MMNLIKRLRSIAFVLFFGLISVVPMVAMQKKLSVRPGNQQSPFTGGDCFFAPMIPVQVRMVTYPMDGGWGNIPNVLVNVPYNTGNNTFNSTDLMEAVNAKEPHLPVVSEFRVTKDGKMFKSNVAVPADTADSYYISLQQQK